MEGCDPGSLKGGSVVVGSLMLLHHGTTGPPAEDISPGKVAGWQSELVADVGSYQNCIRGSHAAVVAAEFGC